MKFRVSFFVALTTAFAILLTVSQPLHAARGVLPAEACGVYLGTVAKRAKLNTSSNVTHGVYLAFRAFRFDILKLRRNDQWRESSLFVNSSDAKKWEIDQAGLAVRALEKSYEEQTAQASTDVAIQSGIQIVGKDNILEFQREIQQQVQELVVERDWSPEARKQASIISYLAGATLIGLDLLTTQGSSLSVAGGVVMLLPPLIGAFRSAMEDGIYIKSQKAMNDVLQGNNPQAWIYSSRSLNVHEDFLYVWSNPSTLRITLALEGQHDLRRIGPQGTYITLPEDRILSIDQLLVHQEGVPVLNIFIRFSKPNPLEPVRATERERAKALELAPVTSRSR